MLKIASFFVTTLFFSASLHAGAACKEHPKNEWLNVLDMQKKSVNEYGLAIKKFQTSGDGYEIYGWGLNEAKTEFVKIEVYFDTKTGEIIKKKED